jgi:hypothetical protein
MIQNFKIFTSVNILYTFYDTNFYNYLYLGALYYISGSHLRTTHVASQSSEQLYDTDMITKPNL